MGDKQSYSEAAREYADAKRMAATAEGMGAGESAQAWRDEADEVRQGFFGRDKN